MLLVLGASLAALGAVIGRHELRVRVMHFGVEDMVGYGIGRG